MKKDVIRIVITDDHQLMRETWKLLLEQHEGLEVIALCTNGAEAIEVARNEKPDIMLLDINMSPVNGFEATRKITKLAPSVKIIGMSVNNQTAYARNMIQLGARGYVTKNSPREEMIHAIQEVHIGRKYICEEILKKMNREDEMNKNP
jgi:two-component system, NarL family, invasion response regulator UvrY